MTLNQTSAASALAISARIAATLLLNKILAVYIGPGGFAVLGQLQNFITATSAVSTGICGNGVTKFTAEFADRQRQLVVWRTAAMVSLSVIVVVVTALTFGATAVIGWLGTPSIDSQLVLIYASSLPLVLCGALILSILNGLNRVSRHLLSSLVGTLFALAITGLLAYAHGLPGALVGVAIHQGIVGLVALILSARLDWIKAKNYFGKPDQTLAIRLVKFALVGVVATVAQSVTQAAIRTHIADQISLETAGCWEAAVRLSSVLVLFVSVPLNLYFLPRFSAVNTQHGQRQLLASAFLFVIPTMAGACLLFYLLRVDLIGLLFTSKFLPIEHFIGWHLLGDVLRAAALVVSYLMLGRGLLRNYIMLELLYNACFLAIVWSFVRSFETAPYIGMAHAIASGVYLVAALYIVLRVYSRGNNGDRNQPGWNIS